MQLQRYMEKIEAAAVRAVGHKVQKNRAGNRNPLPCFRLNSGKIKDVQTNGTVKSAVYAAINQGDDHFTGGTDHCAI